jgi:hypothetical protein
VFRLLASPLAAVIRRSNPVSQATFHPPWWPGRNDRGAEGRELPRPPRRATSQAFAEGREGQIRSGLRCGEVAELEVVFADYSSSTAQAHSTTQPKGPGVQESTSPAVHRQRARRCSTTVPLLALLLGCPACPPHPLPPTPVLSSLSSLRSCSLSLAPARSPCLTSQ